MLKHRFSTGFTIIEMVVVIGLIAALAGISVPATLSYLNKKHDEDASNRASMLDVQKSRYLTEQGSAALTAWAAATDDQGRYALLKSYLVNPPDNLGAGTDTASYTPQGYRIALNGLNDPCSVTKLSTSAVIYPSSGGGMAYLISVSANNSTMGAVLGGGTYQANEQVTVQAQPFVGYRFVQWTDGATVVSTDASFTFAATVARALTANFDVSAAGVYNLTLLRNNTLAGTASPGSGGYANGSVVTLTANPNPSWAFDSWSGDIGGANAGSASINVTMNQDRTIQANFVRTTVTLSIAANNAAYGSVAGGGTLPAGTATTVTATAYPGYAFVNWIDAGNNVVSSANAYQLTVNANTILTAVFATAPATGVTPNTYGTAARVAQFTVDAQGRILGAQEVPIAIPNSAVTGLGTLATQNANSIAVTGGSISGVTFTTPSLVSPIITGGTMNSMSIGPTNPSTARFTSVAVDGLAGTGTRVLAADASGNFTRTALDPANIAGNYVLKAGDTMTGALNLPANGLVVGTNQIVAAGGNIGVGVSPASKVDVSDTTSVTAFLGASKGGLLLRGSGTYNDLNMISFADQNPLLYARIAAWKTSSGSYLSIGTSNNYGSGITNQALTIDYNGSVTIPGTLSVRGQDTDARYVLKTGDTMTGSLTVSNSKVIVDSSTATYELRDGSGNIKYQIYRNPDDSFNLYANGAGKGVFAYAPGVSTFQFLQNVGINIPTTGKAFEVLGEIASRNSAAAGGQASTFSTDSSGANIWVNNSYNPASPGTGWTRAITISPSSFNIGLRGVTSPTAAVDFGTTVANSKKIIGTYTSGNVFTGIGMDAASAGVRIAGDGSGNKLLDIGYYSTDGAYTWSSKVLIDGSGNITANSVNVGGQSTDSRYVLKAGDTMTGALGISGTNSLNFPTYGGGWYMSDATWMRTLANKSIWTGPGVLGSDGGLTIGYGGVTPASGGAIIAGNTVIGANSSEARLQVVGGSVFFNQTSDATGGIYYGGAANGLIVGKYSTSPWPGTNSIYLQGYLNFNGTRLYGSGTFLDNYSSGNGAGAFRLIRNDGNLWGYYYADNGGIGILSGSGNWAILASGAVNANNTDVSFFTDGGARRGYFNSGGLTIDGADLSFIKANPYINASSYFIAPGGAYFNSGTVYFAAQMQARGGIHNDSGANLVLAGGTSGTTEATGNLQVDGTLLVGGQSSDYRYVYNTTAANNSDFNTIGNNSSNVLSMYMASSPNRPPSVTYQYGTILSFNPAGGLGQAQFYVSHAGNDLWFRGGWGNGGSWQTWNRVLTDQIYNNYVPTLSGSGAYGTWGISITGNSGTTSQRTFSNVRTDGINRGSYGSISVSGSSNGWAGIDFADASSTFMVRNSDGYSGIYRNNNTWLWTFDGTGSLVNGTVPWSSVSGRPGISGTWNWSAQGGQPSYLWGSNDGANMYVWNPSNFVVSNVTALAGTWDGLNYFRSNKGSGTYVAGQINYALMAYSSDSGAAAMSFHRGGYYAVNFGLDPDNVMRIGGWSAPANRWQLDCNSGNETVAGSVTAPSFNATSSRRWKEHIQTLPNSWAIEIANRLEPVSYEWKEGFGKGGHDFGFIAEDVSTVVPEVVGRDAHGEINGLDYGRLSTIAIGAVKELTAITQRQEREIAELKRERSRPPGIWLAAIAMLLGGGAFASGVAFYIRARVLFSKQSRTL
ncbi:MAG: tail fiber domain-containing protein [Opitutaceae bacterium]|nr:tail fiber domain-containing protein [Opitutaceae bacterium]